MKNMNEVIAKIDGISKHLQALSEELRSLNGEYTSKGNNADNVASEIAKRLNDIGRVE